MYSFEDFFLRQLYSVRWFLKLNRQEEWFCSRKKKKEEEEEEQREGGELEKKILGRMHDSVNTISCTGGCVTALGP